MYHPIKGDLAISQLEMVTRPDDPKVVVWVIESDASWQLVSRADLHRGLLLEIVAVTLQPAGAHALRRDGCHLGPCLGDPWSAAPAAYRWNGKTMARRDPGKLAKKL